MQDILRKDMRNHLDDHLGLKKRKRDEGQKGKEKMSKRSKRSKKVEKKVSCHQCSQACIYFVEYHIAIIGYSAGS